MGITFIPALVALDVDINETLTSFDISAMFLCKRLISMNELCVRNIAKTNLAAVAVSHLPTSYLSTRLWCYRRIPLCCVIPSMKLKSCLTLFLMEVK